MFKKKLTAIVTAVLVMGGTLTTFAQPKCVYLKSKTSDEVTYIKYEDYMKGYASKNKNFLETLDKYSVTGISVETDNSENIIDFDGYVNSYKNNSVKNVDDYSDKKDCIKATLPKKGKELYKDGSVSSVDTTLPDKTTETPKGDYINIKEARGKGIEKVTIQGVVTGKLGNNFFVQDSTAGIYIFLENTSSSNIKVGDLVKVSGIVDDFSNFKEISYKRAPITIEKLKDANLPEAKLVSVNDIGETLESQLVTLKGLTFESQPTGSSGYNINAEDDKGNKIDIRVDKNVSIDSNEFKNISKFDVTGNVGQFKSTYQIMVRSLDDFKFFNEDGSEIKNEIVEFKKVSMYKGSSLPERLDATMTNGTTKEFSVKWLDSIDSNVLGNKTIKVQVDGKTYVVNVEVIERSGSDPTDLPIELEKYYQKSAGKIGPELKQALHDIIKGHNKLSYSQVWQGIQDTDEDPNNPNNVLLLYSGKSTPKSNHGGLVNQWNREHTWAKSRGNFGTHAGPGTDLHHLRATNVKVNSYRSHYDFDNGGQSVPGAPDCRKTKTTWEPRDEVKGDVARMIFYMAVRYEGDASGEPDLEVIDRITPDNKKGQIGKLSTLLKWNKQDPVDQREKRRNNIIYTKYQHNRNPFIDNPNWADSIWGQ